LTVEESIRYSLRLLDWPESGHGARLERLLAETGLEALRDRRVGRLSGGQLRRMALALELVAEPELLLCDEVTAGLDPESEESILDLIRSLVDGYGKTTVNVIHNLHHLHRFDWILVLDGGRKIFEGDFPAFRSWFGLEEPVRLFRLLGESRDSADWPGRWRDREAHSEPEGRGPAPPPEPQRETSPRAEPGGGTARPAGVVRQAGTLLRRRGRLFLRDRGYLALAAAITVGFPLLVVVFALDGLPQLTRFALDSGLGGLDRLQGELAFAREAADLGSLVSSLILFQVVLLTLTGSGNGAHEIAPEADLFFQESLRGLRPGPYCFEKIVFTGGIAAVQGLAMAVIVKTVVGFPGSWPVQAGALVLVSLALGWLALGFSAWMKSGEKASLLAVYVVGFQLPFSGIVLTLPEPFAEIVRLVISTYWGWAAYLGAFRETGLYDAVVFLNGETAPPVGLSLLVLSLHALLAILLVFSGVGRRRGFA
jgi:energy-coupling factor transporter ATP-binding protein EcfA2